MSYITLNNDNLAAEHICCAFSDKKCAEGYQQKKQWLASQFEQGYTFRRINERAKVFIEYGPTEHAWVPVIAPNTMILGCFWVSGRYKNHGHGKALLQEAIDAAKAQGMDGLVAVAGSKKFHFMSDTRWLMRQGFTVCDTATTGFSLLSLNFNPETSRPHFATCAKSSVIPNKNGIVVYYSNRCPFSEYHVHHSLSETAVKRNLPLQIIKLETMEQAQAAPTPATIFSLFLNGQFVTTDIGSCMDNRFDKAISKLKL